MSVTTPLQVPVSPPKPLEEEKATPLYPELLEAAELVRERWQQNRPETRRGSWSDFVCVGIAMERSGARRRSPAGEHFLNSIGLEPKAVGKLFDWNDTPGRTAEEVAEALERAAYGL